MKITPAGWAEATSILADLAEELARARDRIDWRPIETAPKDGTRVLLCCTGGAGSVSDGCFYNNAWSWEWAGVVDPTHWAPLNLPPGAHFVGDDAALQITLNEDRICIEWRT